MEEEEEFLLFPYPWFDQAMDTEWNGIGLDVYIAAEGRRDQQPDEKQTRNER
uniref:Uncharacterized protein n=1 Tax=Arundo donax TaxID=35708 RepID=A0A0A9GEN1_ARUDO